MNAQNLADDLNLPIKTVTAAVRSVNADPDNFDEKTGDRVRSMVEKTVQQNKGGPKKIAAATKEEVAEPPPKTEIENYQDAALAIRERQIQQKLEDAQQRGRLVGSMVAVEEFKGELEGYTVTRNDLIRMLATRDDEFFQLLLGNSATPSKLLPAVYHENQQSTSPNLLEAWEEKSGLNWNYE